MTEKEVPVPKPDGGHEVVKVTSGESLIIPRVFWWPILLGSLATLLFAITAAWATYSAITDSSKTDQNEAAFEEALKVYICARPLPGDFTERQKELAQQFCDLPPLIDLEDYIEDRQNKGGPEAQRR